MLNINALIPACTTGGANALLFVPLMEQVAVNVFKNVSLLKNIIKY